MEVLCYTGLFEFHTKLCMGKTLIDISAEVLIFLQLKMTYLSALLSLFEFPLLRKSRDCTLDSGMTPTRSAKKKQQQQQQQQQKH